MELKIDSGWQLRHEPLDVTADFWPVVSRRSEGWLPCALPCDVHMPLIVAGIISEPLDKLNCFESEWIEERSWWFRTTFSAPAAFRKGARCDLVLEMLDVEADIFLNDVCIGHQRSAFYPFRFDVRNLLLPGENVVGVRLTTGLERVAEQEFAGFKKNISTEADAGRGTRGDRRRAILRKPQYVFGWDWGPRVATAGIMGGVSLKLVGPVHIASVHAATRVATADRAELAVTVEVENTHVFSTRECEVTIQLARKGKKVATARAALPLRSGVNFVDMELEIPSPELWWPNGYGEQPLYTLTANAVSGKLSVEYPAVQIGIRTVEIDQTPEFDGRRFSLVVNGTRVFSKGSNWIPADSIYARVSDEKYDRLVQEAKEANFTMLRIWGGGRYEADRFYEACDRAGILVWHDFMFACSAYPDNREWFREEVRREADYQTCRLRNHACMGLFSGSNENNWFFDEWWDGKAGPQPTFVGGAFTYNYILPSAVRTNCPEIPYWNGSPYGGAHPNGNDAGDRHHWLDATMSPKMENRISPETYDNVTARFISEYGYIGPCARSTIERYHAGESIDQNGAIWQHHNNTFEKSTVLEGIRKHYMDPESLTIDQYLLYASLVQSLMYSYSLEAFRIQERNSGGLFWMYSDCWGEVGWTIIDYYLTRKPSFYAVKRAFAPRKLVLRAREDNVVVFAMNESAEEVKTVLEIGTLRLDGDCISRKSIEVSIPPRFSGILASIKKASSDAERVLWYARCPAASGFSPATLREGELRKLKLDKPGLSITGLKRSKGTISFKVKSQRFAHAVHFGLPWEVEASDEYFDLLPGEERRITLTASNDKLPATVTARSVIPGADASQ